MQEFVVIVAMSFASSPVPSYIDAIFGVWKRVWYLKDSVEGWMQFQFQVFSKRTMSQ